MEHIVMVNIDVGHIIKVNIVKVNDDGVMEQMIKAHIAKVNMLVKEHNHDASGHEDKY